MAPEVSPESAHTMTTPPRAPAAFGDFVRSTQRAPGVNFDYGLYTSRGTCQCSEADYHGPGSQGYEAVDVKWMVAAGATYLKARSRPTHLWQSVALAVPWQPASGSVHCNRGCTSLWRRLIADVVGRW